MGIYFVALLLHLRPGESKGGWGSGEEERSRTQRARLQGKALICPAFLAAAGRHVRVGEKKATGRRTGHSGLASATHPQIHMHETYHGALPRLFHLVRPQSSAVPSVLRLLACLPALGAHPVVLSELNPSSSTTPLQPNHPCRGKQELMFQSGQGCHGSNRRKEETCKGPGWTIRRPSPIDSSVVELRNVVRARVPC